MNSARPLSNPPRLGAARLATGWLVLLIYTGACSPAGLGLAALLGSMDPNHQIRMSASKQGVRLVLHHGGNCQAHHHGPVAYALTFFAQPASPTDPDHVLQFANAESFTRKAQMIAPLVVVFDQPIFTEAELLPCFGCRLFLLATPHPPPDASSRLDRPHSTQLLI